MGIIEILLLGIGLSMDAFAVSVCKGLSVNQLRVKHALIVGIYFGGFQALMPFIGYLLGSQFQSLIASVDHWVAFVLLVLIGANMVREALGEENAGANDSFSFRTMLPLAVATSIDALAVGITFAFLQVNIVLAITLIGCTTFVISAVGIKIGNVFGSRYQKKAEITGGIILILLGVKILLEHMGVLSI
jgi:putative Mn2+ efflux pump MntP